MNKPTKPSFGHYPLSGWLLLLLWGIFFLAGGFFLKKGNWAVFLPLLAVQCVFLILLTVLNLKHRKKKETKLLLCSLLAVILFVMNAVLPAWEGEGIPLGVDYSHGKTVSEYDTHGGFHGDGISCITYHYTDDALEKEIQSSAEWKPLPLSETADILLYGRETDGPYLTAEGTETPLVPPVENGYWYFYDRHAESTDPHDDNQVLKRYSLNFTIAVYDADKDLLHVLEMDT